MFYIFTGNGKGKTTAALGQALRAVGEGKKVLMVQFIKGPWKSGEDLLLENFQFSIFNFQIRKTGLGFVGILGDTKPFVEHQKAAEEGLELARKEIESRNWNIVILDEVNNAVSLGLIAKEKVLELLDLVTSNQPVPYRTESSGAGLPVTIIFTGRDAPQEFIDRADLVTEMREIKHPYQKGVRGKRGLEY